MKKAIVLFFSILMLSRLVAIPDEGMWLPNKIAQLNYADMQKLGCKLTAEEIYSINNSSLKDAIFQLQSAEGSGFCTGEIVSKQGLLFTNHHCGYEAITSLSTTEHNYLDNGYWAKSHKDEISVPGIRVTRVVRIEDVTEQVLLGITDETSESERQKIIDKAITKIEEEAIKDTHYEAAVSEMYQGGEYYLFVYEAFGDVRFVGAPPSSIGKFGGDTDNWMWPRHTGDFSIFRVYMSPDGKPTQGYDENNVPYVPLHSLPISISGVEEGDFTMIMGYPGQTERYLSSYGMIYKRDFFNPSIVKVLELQLNVLKEEMASDINIRLAYADSYASNANGHKLFKGEALTLTNTDAIQQKEMLEAEFQQWVDSDDARKEKYGDVLPNLKNSYEAFGPATNDIIYLSLGLLQAGEHVMSVQSFMSLARLLEDSKANADAINDNIEMLRPEVEEMYAKYYPKVDQKVFEAMLKLYVTDIPAENRNGVFANYIFKKYKGKTEFESIEKLSLLHFPNPFLQIKPEWTHFWQNQVIKSCRQILFTRMLKTFLEICLAFKWHILEQWTELM